MEKGQITKSDCMERLLECLKKSSFSHVLTDHEREQMDYSLQIISAFAHLNDVEEITNVNAIGFNISEDDEEDEDEDDNDEE